MTERSQTYHPHRFQRIFDAPTSRAKRVQGVAMTPKGSNTEDDGMGEDEINSRFRHQRRVTEAQNQWAAMEHTSSTCPRRLHRSPPR